MTVDEALQAHNALAAMVQMYAVALQSLRARVAELEQQNAALLQRLAAHERPGVAKAKEPDGGQR